MPRPTKITEARINVIVASIERGDYKITACNLAGISDRTLDNWLAKGEAENNESNIDPDRHTRAELDEIAEHRDIDTRGCRTKADVAARINAEESPFLRLFRLYKMAFATAESVALGQAVRTGQDDWRFWMTFLERSRPQRWARRVRLEEEIEDDTMAIAGDEEDAQHLLDRAAEIKVKMLGTGT